MRPQRVRVEGVEQVDRFNRVLEETIEALEGASIHYVFIGGIASGGLGRPRSTQDIDVFVRPEEAEKALQVLAAKGFKTERTDPSWLFKAFKNGILVDVIFKSKGDIYLDSEMYQRMTTAEFHGKKVRLCAPEDLIIIKALAHSEMTPGHWHDAIGLLSHANIDWDYLVHRARRAPRRVLSLLLYAQSIDLWVPKSTIERLFRIIFGDVAPPMPRPRPTLVSVRVGDPVVTRVRDSIAKDPRLNELDIHVEFSKDGKLVLRGEVQTAEKRDVVGQIAAEICGECQIENQIHVLQLSEPAGSEEIR